jgi:hypothetical protein
LNGILRSAPETPGPAGEIDFARLMPTALPLLDWLLLAYVVYAVATPRLTLRESLLVSAVIAAAWLVVGIEIRS